MNLKSPKFLAAAIALSLSVTSLSAYAFPQKKKKSAAENAPPAVKLEVAAPAQTPAPPTPAPKAQAQAGTVSSEKDPQREAWRINVDPYAIIGSGIDLSRRGETLTVREFAQLADAIAAARESTSPVGLES